MLNALKVTACSFPRTLSLELNKQVLCLWCFPKERPFHLNISLKESPKSSIPVKNIETQNFKGSENHTWVGPPHELSNLRLKVFPQIQNLTDEEKQFYHRSQEIQDWNQTYWENHNKDFIKSRKKFLEKIVKEKNLPKKEALTSQEMSEFYKHFLDTNHKKHMQYNWNWYKKNITLIFLAAKAKYSKLRKIFKS